MLEALKSNPDITAQLLQNRNQMNANNQMVINNQPMNNYGMNQMNNHPMNPQMQMNSKLESHLHAENSDKINRIDERTSNYND